MGKYGGEEAYKPKPQGSRESSIRKRGERKVLNC